MSVVIYRPSDPSRHITMNCEQCTLTGQSQIYQVGALTPVVLGAQVWLVWDTGGYPVSAMIWDITTPEIGLSWDDNTHS